jgi:hypothetical protein
MDYYTWQVKIMEHRRGNNLDIPVNMMAIAEDQLCGTLPPGFCIYEVNDQSSVDIRIGVADVLDWLNALKRKILSGEPYVEKDEANRRAAICVSCPLNVQAIGGCGSNCNKIVERLTPGMAKQSTLFDSQLKTCAVCHCYNSVQVHFPLAVLGETDTPKLPDHCWRKPSGPNYRSDRAA